MTEQEHFEYVKKSKKVKEFEAHVKKVAEKLKAIKDNHIKADEDLKDEGIVILYGKENQLEEIGTINCFQCHKINLNDGDLAKLLLDYFFRLCRDLKIKEEEVMKFVELNFLKYRMENLMKVDHIEETE